MELSKAEDKPLSWNKTRLKQVDWVLIVVLWASAFAFRAPATKGDLWFDEADYAFAAMRGFEANRLDKEVSAADPEKLVRYRHFHPPGIAYLIQVGLTFSYREQAVRACSLLIGCSSVVLHVPLRTALVWGKKKTRIFSGTDARSHPCRHSRLFPCDFLVLYCLLPSCVVLDDVAISQDTARASGFGAVGWHLQECTLSPSFSCRPC
ncbi:MAG: hypothetical protein H7308_08000 [Chthonomonadaceae bacterium]|nr:hypothetical protein [Chthonomonadaceae bacterium]